MDLKEITQLYDFTGKTIVITGATGVLGGEIACALLGCGANIAMMDRNTKLEADLVKRIDSTVGRVIVIYGNVLKRPSLEKCAAKIIEEFGRIDYLINAAGGNHPEATTGPQKAFFDLPEKALQFTAELNLLGTMLPSQVFGKYMAEQREGVILNISSMNALRPLTRIPAYSAAKAAVSNFTQWLAVHMAQEYSPDIRVNAVAPGFFLTRQNRFLLTDEKSGELTPRGKSIIDHTPMGRFGQPEDLLGAVLWLLSPASKFVTGIVVPVDGGFSAFSGV
ncbi:MAG: SDR family oxidoreductase [Calditrichaeota bacterium]|nr:SDR family oxidoreductase [Calditrichota bacterium]MCB0304516.1 SDR family oxidoreductase [Calditrichota bacterium]